MCFVSYICLVLFVIMNVLTALCVHQVSKLAEKDAEMVHQDELNKRTKVMMQLRQVFGEADLNRSGKISWSRIFESLKYPFVQCSLASLGLDVCDLCIFFKVLSNPDFAENGDDYPTKSWDECEVDIEKFIQGCCHLRGQPKNIDMAAMQHDIESQHASLQKSLRCEIEIAFKMLAEQQMARDLKYSEDLKVQARANRDALVDMQITCANICNSVNGCDESDYGSDVEPTNQNSGRTGTSAVRRLPDLDLASQRYNHDSPLYIRDEAKHMQDDLRKNFQVKAVCDSKVYPGVYGHHEYDGKLVPMQRAPSSPPQKQAPQQANSNAGESPSVKLQGLLVRLPNPEILASTTGADASAGSPSAGAPLYFDFDSGGVMCYRDEPSSTVKVTVLDFSRIVDVLVRSIPFGEVGFAHAFELQIKDEHMQWVKMRFAALNTEEKTKWLRTIKEFMAKRVTAYNNFSKHIVHRKAVGEVFVRS